MEARAYNFRMNYKDKTGVTVYVAKDESGEKWGTFYDNGGLRRIVRSALPLRSTFDEAQADLDAYALDKELGAAEMPKYSAPLVPHHFNEHGVCENPEDIVIPFPKSSKVTGSVFLALTPDPKGGWVSNYGLDAAWGEDQFHSSGLPGLIHHAFPTREHAVEDALGDMFACLNKAHAGPKRMKLKEAAVNFLDQYEWHDENPDLETSGAPEGAPEQTDEASSGGAESRDSEEGVASAPPPTPTQDEKDENRRLEHVQRMNLYHNELRLTASLLIRTKEEKKESDREFNESIKGYDVRMADLLYKMREEEQTFAGYMAPPPPGALPFDAPVNQEVNKEAAATLDGDPPTVPCGHCLDGKLANETDCPRCMGTGNIIPQPDVPKGDACSDCLNCNHPAAAHFEAEGHHPRPCIIDKCGCTKYEPFQKEQREGIPVEEAAS